MSLQVAGWIYSLSFIAWLVSGHLLIVKYSGPRLAFAFVASLLTIVVQVWYAFYTQQYGFLAVVLGILILAVAETRMVLNASQDS